MFENDVKTYGTQTQPDTVEQPQPFENDVKTYGTQTIKRNRAPETSLRMM